VLNGVDEARLKRHQRMTITVTKPTMTAMA
jgi:hypothetical protein